MSNEIKTRGIIVIFSKNKILRINHFTPTPEFLNKRLRMQSYREQNSI